MRLFVAAELPDEMAEAACETIASLRDCVRGRFVPPENLHVTLAFLGEVAAPLVDDAAAAVERAASGVGAVPARLGELGAFGHGRRVTLWQAVESAGALEGLAAGVRAALRDEGFSFDEKPFLPHVTLVRAADLSRGPSLAAPATASGDISRVTLFRSQLRGDEPPRYEPLATFGLE